jgi:hypothetical protein
MHLKPTLLAYMQLLAQLLVSAAFPCTMTPLLLLLLLSICTLSCCPCCTLFLLFVVLRVCVG